MNGAKITSFLTQQYTYTAGVNTGGEPPVRSSLIPLVRLAEFLRDKKIMLHLRDAT